MTLHNLASQTALKLPEVTITQPFGDGCDVFKVMDKVFMLSFHLKGQAAINLKVIPDDGAMLRDIYPYIRAGWHMNKQHWVTVYEDENLDAALVHDLIKNSYELVVSKLNKVQRQRIALLKSAI
ncbi:MmcQ/YjbR family DNA-binding protein [Acinetobacter haemolyticus]|jgi:predicted DNA-binding protein (MmcQ/YjbR family)|uniref:MmcQ/YjbR family DNA-binding protein n=1 Tax=Acinetobacter sp. YH01022 TaxID=2601036 RepID=UPI0015D3F88A|nr:MmcQ/YjbR family DNA-binding protein [Acinetobacter sp. YH01022]UDM38782.1 MmcQ/YjbR family DNA-binding protein [Acinetobacter haemolyticus]